VLDGPRLPPAAAEAPQSARSDGRAADAAASLRQSMNRRLAGPRTTMDAIGAIHRLLTQQSYPCAVIIESADLIVGDLGQHDPDYRTVVAHLRRLLEDAVETVSTPTQPSLRNELVFVVREVGTLPSWLRDSANVAVVPAERPGPAERAHLLGGQVAMFHGAETLSEEAIERSVTALANLTDGMTVRDIQALSTTSQMTRIGATAPRRLVARHRYGLRADPWEQLDLAKVKSAADVLNARVMGQPEAVQQVVEVVVNARIGIDFVPGDADSSNRPKGVFFFVGPTGVGKTELAKAVAEMIFDDESAMRRFDMSEFSQEHASERLTGAPPGYLGHEQGGVLTNWVLERPFSVILFDEIEKADPRIFDKFLQIIDDGRLTDGRGRTADFSHSIVIFTSNQGAATLRAVQAETMSYADIRAHFAGEVDRYFSQELRRPELLGRLGGGIVVFDILRPAVVRGITEKFLNQICDSASARGYHLDLDREAIHIAMVDEVVGNGASLGARPIRDPNLERWIRRPLNQWIMANTPAPGTRIRVHSPTGALPFTVEASSPALPSGIQPEE
jgi:hypothetical protein